MQVSYWVQCSRVGGTVDYCSRRKICVRSGPEILAMITIHCVLQASRPVSAAAVVLHVPCLLQQVPPPQISVVRETFSLLSCVAAHEVAVCLIWREKAIVLQVSPSRACQFFAQRLMCSVQLSFQFIFQLVIDVFVSDVSRLSLFSDEMRRLNVLSGSVWPCVEWVGIVWAVYPREVCQKIG